MWPPPSSPILGGMVCEANQGGADHHGSDKNEVTPGQLHGQLPERGNKPLIKQVISKEMACFCVSKQHRNTQCHCEPGTGVAIRILKRSVFISMSLHSGYDENGYPRRACALLGMTRFFDSLFCNTDGAALQRYQTETVLICSLCRYMAWSALANTSS